MAAKPLPQDLRKIEAGKKRFDAKRKLQSAQLQPIGQHAPFELARPKLSDAVKRS